MTETMGIRTTEAARDRKGERDYWLSHYTPVPTRAEAQSTEPDHHLSRLHWHTNPIEHADALAPPCLVWGWGWGWGWEGEGMG